MSQSASVVRKTVVVNVISIVVLAIVFFILSSLFVDIYLYM